MARPTALRTAEGYHLDVPCVTNQYTQADSQCDALTIRPVPHAEGPVATSPQVYRMTYFFFFTSTLNVISADFFSLPARVIFVPHFGEPEKPVTRQVFVLTAKS